MVWKKEAIQWRQIRGYTLEQQNPVVQIQNGEEQEREQICTERSDYSYTQTERDSAALCCCKKGRCISGMYNEKDAMQNVK